MTQFHFSLNLTDKSMASGGNTDIWVTHNNTRLKHGTKTQHSLTKQAKTKGKKKKITAMHFTLHKVNTNHSTGCKFGPRPYCPIWALQFNSGKTWRIENIHLYVLSLWTIISIYCKNQTTLEGRRLSVLPAAWTCNVDFILDQFEVRAINIKGYFWW